MPEKTIDGWLVVDWKQGTHRTRQSKPKQSELGSTELLAELSVHVTVPEVDIPTLAVEIDVPEGKPYRNPWTLLELYHFHGLTTTEIADRFGCHHGTVWKYMDRYGIKRRDPHGRVAGRDKSLEERFWEKVDRRDPAECWEWQAARDKDGYGKFDVDGEQRFAHRVSHGLAKETAEGSLVLHHCDNPPCVNPSHLYLGDYADNARDMYDRGGRSQAGVENNQAKLTEDEVVSIKRRLREGEQSQQEIADAFGVARTTISDIKHGRNWAHVSLIDEGLPDWTDAVHEVLDEHDLDPSTNAAPIDDLVDIVTTQALLRVNTRPDPHHVRDYAYNCLQQMREDADA